MYCCIFQSFIRAKRIIHLVKEISSIVYHASKQLGHLLSISSVTKESNGTISKVIINNPQKCESGRVLEAFKTTGLNAFSIRPLDGEKLEVKINSEHSSRFETGSSDSLGSVRNTQDTSWGVRDEQRILTSFKLFIQDKSVLDVGCGKGLTTLRLLQECSPSELVAIEPDSEYAFAPANELLKPNGVSVVNVDLQDYIASGAPKADTVTVFKYNIPLSQRDYFLKSLAKSIKENGVVLITSVEKERCFDQSSPLFLMDALRNNFESVNVQIIKHSSFTKEGLIICRHPAVISEKSGNQGSLALS